MLPLTHSIQMLISINLCIRLVIVAIFYFLMGAATQKSIKNIIEAKYSFVHPKSHYPLQISCWRFTEEDLERKIDSDGEGVRWPFKLYSDEGYIFACIQNENCPRHESKGGLLGHSWGDFGNLRVSVGVIELLYSFANRQVEEYASNKIQLQNKSKYIKDRLTLTLYIYSGQNLSSLAKLKLITHATALERYISRGGICSISKLYHEYDEIIDLGKEIKAKDDARSKNDEFYIQISSLIEDKVRFVDDQKLKKELQDKELQNLYERMCNYNLLKKLLIDRQIKHPSCCLISQNATVIYPTLDCSAWNSNKNLVIRQQIVKKIVQPVKEEEKKINDKKQVQNLNESLPFPCEITEINFKEKKKVGQVQYLNESMSIAELSVLSERHLNFIKIICEEEDYLVLTDYPSIRQFMKFSEFNIHLVINNSASLCYNYFINDFEYVWNYITPLPAKPPAEAVLFEYNIEHIMQPITEAIIKNTCNNKKGESLNNRVAIYSSSSPFSDENCALVMGYLICRYLYSFDKAFDVLNRHFKEYKKSKQARLEVHRLYVDQLLTLEGRILITSLPTYGVSLNSSMWRVYQVSNNHCHPSQLLINRYIGQISNLNQLYSLPGHDNHFYLAISHQVVTSLTLIVQKWEKDTTIKVPQGITGIKMLVGKEFKFRDEFISKGKEMLPYILKYEFISRNRNNYSFNNLFLFKFIQEIVNNNVQIENIEKSFRKVQPFTPLYSGFEQENPGKQLQKISQPFSLKQKLIFKYPYLRPTWEAIKDDQHYFIIQIRQDSASIEVVKGKNWIGLENDKQAFLDNLVKLYIENIDESKIEIVEEGEESLFADHSEI